MGYRVRKYDLDELRRISLPGAVVPSLFWALPVGQWEQHDVDRLWNHFTNQRGSNCSDLGLILVADISSRHDAGQSDLTQAGAALVRVLPQGTERYVGLRDSTDAARHLLILSSAYPQPGWGVLIPIPDDHRVVDTVSHVVDTAIGELRRHDATAAAERILLEASDSFRAWKAVDQQRIDLDTPRKLGETVRIAADALVTIDNLKRLAAAGSHTVLTNALADFINVIDGPLSSEVAEAVARLRALHKSLLKATDYLALPADVLLRDVEPRLSAIRNNPQSQRSILKACKDRSANAAILAGLYIDGLTPEAQDLPLAVRADSILKSSVSVLTTELTALSLSIESKLTDDRALHTSQQRALDDAQELRRRRSMAAREAFHRAIGQAAEVQWRIGPRMLMAFETAAIASKLPPIVIPWDPARMIGWKLQVKNVPLTLYDLQHTARQLGLEISASVMQNANEADTTIDGSYFTDYIHYIAVSKPGEPPRSVAQSLLATMLSPAQLLRLSATQADGEGPSFDDDRQTLANSALSHLGWQEDSTTRKISLAEWSNSLKSAPNAPLTTGTVIDVRKSLENLCKDILDIVTHRLGCSEADLWRALEERAPDYQPTSRRRRWIEEVGNLTPGSASRLISALAPLAFPNKGSEIGECVAALDKLTPRLNEPAHDRESDSPPPVPQALAEELDILLKHCASVFRELPWHLSPAFVHGEQPKVICGEAWSHGHPIRRMLRVIAFSDEPVPQDMVLWNPTGINPVVADPIFLRRGAPF